MASSSFQCPHAYESLQTHNNEEWPGPRCGHTLTLFSVNDSHLLILFGGSTLAVTTGDIGLEGVTNMVHCFDLWTRRWTRVNAGGEVPSPRADHAAASVGAVLLIQGGISPSGPCTGDIYMLNISHNVLMWRRLIIQSVAPGPRYGHVMGLVAKRWLVVFGGKNGRHEILDDTWALDTHSLSAWERLNPDGNLPSERMYASATARDDGILLLCGGMDHLGMPLGDTYVLKIHSNVHWEWTLLPCVAPSQRYLHAGVFVDQRFYAIGGVLNRNHLIGGKTVISVLDTEAGEWLGTDGPETSNHGSNGQDHNQPISMRRFRHAAASVGSIIYIYGGLTKDVMLNDFIGVETSQLSSSEPELPSFMGSLSESSMEPLAESNNLPTLEGAFYSSEVEGYDQSLQQRAETVGNQGGLGSQLSLDRFENESQHTREEHTQILHKRIISTLLRPTSWTPPTNREFFLTFSEIENLCGAAVRIFTQEPTILQLETPIKIFGDLHGQFGTLMRLFHEYGSPCVEGEGDITHIDYLFLGDYVDRGQHSLETIVLLLALKIEYPKNIHLIRGNHESLSINNVYGFLAECKERMGNEYGLQTCLKFNNVFNHLPLAALIGNKVLCMHGGIGRTIWLDEIASLQRPVSADYKSAVLKDLLWSDPAANDTILGIEQNPRGEDVVSFGSDIVEGFLERNSLEMIIRAHECVMDGFERFAGGQLITVFSATNYCGVVKNAGAILVIGRDWVIVPKMIHPVPPPISSSSEDSSDISSWMQELNIERPPTPARGNSTA